MFRRIITACLVLCMALLLCGCQHVDLLPWFVIPEQPTATPLADLPGELVMLSFSERSSYFARIQGIDFLAEDGVYTAYFWLANEDEPYPVPVDQAWVDELTDIVRRNNMLLWDGFSGSDSMLLDGTSFGVLLEFSDGTTVNAGGYGVFPENYGEASAAIEALFLPLLPENMRDW